MADYEYQSSDFTSLGANDVDFHQLHHEVEESSINNNLKRIHTTWGGGVEFDFNGNLSGAEETTLDNIVANHDGAGLDIEHLSVPDSEGESTTTSTSYQTKLTHSPGILESGVKYRIGWYCEVCNSSTSGRTEIQVAYDGTVIANPSIESEDYRDWVPFTGFYYLPEDTAVTSITLKYRRQSDGTAKIRRARLEIQKAD